MPAAMSCKRSSGGVSIRILVPLLLSTTAPTRDLVSRGSGDRQTSQWHPSCGTPKLVPVPRKVSFTGGAQFAQRGARASYCFHLEQIGRSGHIERHSGSDDHPITCARQALATHGLEREPHHFVVGVTVRHKFWNYAPNQRELTEGSRDVRQNENGDAWPVRRDDARAESTLREDDERRRVEHPDRSRSSICVAVITGRPRRLHSAMMRFCAYGTSSNGSSTPRSPRATITPSDARTIVSMFSNAESFSILATTSIDFGISARSSAMSCA